MPRSGVLRLLLSSSALLGAAACLVMVGEVWDRDQAKLVADLARDAAASTKPFLVVVDAGHGGMDGGTQGHGLLEKDVVLDLALRLEKRLINRGCKVVMTRSDDTFLELDQRSAAANRLGAEAFVSVHLNADPHSSDTSGVETYFSSHKKLGATTRLRESMGLKHDIPIRDLRSEWLAGMVHRRLCRDTGALDRQVRDSHYVVVMHSECPAILVECGYLTNADEAHHFTNEGYKDKVADAIAESTVAFLQAVRMNPKRGLKFEPPLQEPETPVPDEAEPSQSGSKPVNP